MPVGKQRDSTRSPEDFCQISSIHGFSELFSHDAVYSEGPRKTLSSDWPNGVKFGSTLLISGPPGAGKTTFALATVRAMMAEANNRNKLERTITYYISSEVHEKQLIANFEAFGWFQAKSKKPGGGFHFKIDSPEPDETNFYAITPMPEVDRPVPSPEELVNGIFNRISHTLLPSEAPTEPAKIYVIVDSITALLKGCSSAGDERRQTHEIMRRLQDRFGEKYLALTVLLAEHDHRSQQAVKGDEISIPTGPSVEDYLADIVFRLYLRSMPLGRRSRVLEIVKSQGVNMILGEHSWHIITNDNASEILRDPQFEKYIRKLCLGAHHVKRTSKSAQFGGIVIFPRPRLQINHHLKGKTKNSRPLDIGTKGLGLNVSPGSNTLIAGPMGCGKTTLCRQFLKVGRQGQKWRRVLVSFDVPNELIPDANKFTSLHFTQTQFDLNVLVGHINWILDQGCERIAFDGLSEWITMFDKPEAARMLEALMVTIRRYRGDKPVPAVMMTYEMPLDDDPQSPAAVGTSADNLIVVRQVPINDRLHNVIYMLKRDGGLPVSEASPTTQHPGELKSTGVGLARRLIVDKTSLEAYTNLLNPRLAVEPAHVLLQMFAENNAEKLFNDYQVNRIKRHYGGRINLSSTSFSLSEIGSTLEAALGAGKPGQAFSLAIHSVDEWWLRLRGTGDFLTNLFHQSAACRPKHRDFWWFEVEKAFWQPSAAQKKASPCWHAVPAYMDFGMFCIDTEALSANELTPIDRNVNPECASPNTGVFETPASLRNRWRRLVSEVPRLWAQESKGNPGWFEKGNDANPTILSYGLKVTGQMPDDKFNLTRKPIFSFDSSTTETCACMFFEMAWAFGARESFLGEVDSANMEPARKALRFMQFMVMEGLMPARSSSHSRNHGGQHILFSRHWYSTLQKQPGDTFQMDGSFDKCKTVDSKSGRNGGLVALPFMPTGLADRETALAALLEDIAVRQYYWALRVKKRGTPRAPVKDSQNEPAALLAMSKEFLTSTRSHASAQGAPRSGHLIKLVDRAIDIYSLGREWLLKLAAQSVVVSKNENAALGDWSADLDDLIELSSWAAFRLRLLFGRNGGSFPKDFNQKSTDPAANAVYEARWVRHCLPDLSPLKGSFDIRGMIVTGFVCSGSWMFGVGKDSRSSEIQGQILAELTSLESAEKRAATGAGIPPRKDFFYLNGETPVKGMEYLNWRELLRFGGSRARRRDRVLVRSQLKPGSLRDGENQPPATAESLSRLYSVIQRELLNCLRIADLCRAGYANEATKEKAIIEVSKVANLAVESIFKTAWNCLNPVDAAA